MSALSATERAQMRSDTEIHLIDSCTIRRRTLAADGRGGQTETWADVATGVACRLALSSTRIQVERVVAEKQSALPEWTVWLPHSQDVAQSDRIVIGSRTFEVALIDSATYRALRRVETTEVL